MDSGSKSNVDRLNNEISEVHKIMTENINILLDRERNLESVSAMSNRIKEDSKTFKKKAYETRMRILLSRYSILIAIVGIVILFFVFKYYF
jgi:vesicle transport protein SEC22